MASIGAIALGAMAFSPGAALAVDKVSAVHAFPTFLVYTKTFLAMVDDINKKGEGIVEITRNRCNGSCQCYANGST